MPADPALPPSLKATLADITRRLRNLERSPRLTSASIKGGLLRVLDSAGRAVLEIGQRGTDTVFRMNRTTGTAALYMGRTSTGSEFVSLVDKANRIVVSDDGVAGGLATPWVPVAISPGGAVKEIGFVYLEVGEAGPLIAYDLRFLHQHPRLLLEGAVWAEAGTTAQVDLIDRAASDALVLNLGSATGGATVVFQPTVTAAQLQSATKLQTYRSLAVRLTRTAGSGRCGARLYSATGIQS